MGPTQLWLTFQLIHVNPSSNCRSVNWCISDISYLGQKGEEARESVAGRQTRHCQEPATEQQNDSSWFRPKSIPKMTWTEQHINSNAAPCASFIPFLLSKCLNLWIKNGALNPLQTSLPSSASPPLEKSKSFLNKTDKGKGRGRKEKRKLREGQRGKKRSVELIISHWIKTNLMKWGMGECVCACMHVASELYAWEFGASRVGVRSGASNTTK